MWGTTTITEGIRPSASEGEESRSRSTMWMVWINLDEGGPTGQVGIEHDLLSTN